MLEASKYASVYTRSVSMQIEYWVRIGKIAEENPDLTYTFIEDILFATGFNTQELACAREIHGG